MRFVVDAQLPPKLALLLVDLGQEAIHVAQLDGGLTASDREIASEADARGAAVITKDSDFKHSHLAAGTPKKLLLVEVGNIANPDLFALVRARLRDLVVALSGADFVELRRDVLVVHAWRSSDQPE